MNKIKITFPDGNIKEFDSGITAFSIAESISGRLAKESLAAKVNGAIFDLYRPLTDDAEIQFLTFNEDEGKEVYWHSTSHLMAHAVQEIYPEAKFGVGPAIDAGFYYDIDINSTLHDEDLKKIEDKMIEFSKENKPFVREELSTDLCRGPHLPSSGKIKYIKLLNISGSYWRGDEKNKQLQRIYGISFPKKKMLDEYLYMLEESKKRDHRKLGKHLDLFSTHEEAGAGLIYWHPKGARVRLEIEDYWRKAHLDNGYEILYTPHMGKSWLWETSGHLDFYKESMFSKMDVDEQDYFIKPMNCPFHILIYKSHLRSYRDLPMRWAELGTVYRYEKSGVLHGLLRVRGFTQDDAHIFCTHEQIEDEIIKKCS
jgi:threonyl-tRNA synthetase